MNSVWIAVLFLGLGIVIGVIGTRLVYQWKRNAKLVDDGIYYGGFYDIPSAYPSNLYLNSVYGKSPPTIIPMGEPFPGLPKGWNEFPGLPKVDE